jgi:three-Cys-motif partner protein
MEFFDGLQKHSDAKITVLNNYFIPWLRKINLSFQGGRCLVIDGFAGPGIYEDGKIGSPIKLLQGSIEFYEQCEKNEWKLPQITLLFIEGNKGNFENLKKNIAQVCDVDFEEDIATLKDYPTIKAYCINNNFQVAFKELLDSIKPHESLIPSFCFVDPFGYKDTPFELFEKYLSNKKAELLYNFMFEEINRFITTQNSPKLMETYSKLFGVNSIEELQEFIGDNKRDDRKKIVVDYYSRQLLDKTAAKYVLNFEFKKNGRTKMFLFYATKSPHGLQLMKKQMWKVDDTGLYLFDDKKQANQIQFEFVKDMQDDNMRQDLADQLFHKFTGKTVHIDTIKEFVLLETIYPIENFMKNSLKILEKKQLVTATNRKKALSYPDNCRVSFL